MENKEYLILDKMHLKPMHFLFVSMPNAIYHYRRFTNLFAVVYAVQRTLVIYQAKLSCTGLEKSYMREKSPQSSICLYGPLFFVCVQPIYKYNGQQNVYCISKQLHYIVLI